MPPNESTINAPIAASLLTPAQKIDAASGLVFASQRAIATEIPVSFVYGDAPYAVMMASPGDSSMSSVMPLSPAETLRPRISDAERTIPSVRLKP